MADVTRVDHAKVGGAALAVGYALVLAVLYRSPGAGLEAATASGQSVLYFLVLPIAGVGAGVYAYRGGPYRTVPILILGGYLGVGGLGLTLGALLAPETAGVVLGTGIAGVACAVVALVASLAELGGGVRLEPLLGVE